jgi:hypothetical protein
VDGIDKMQIAGPSKRQFYNLMPTSASTRRFRLATGRLLFIVVAPLVASCVLFGRQLWTSQWTDVGVGLGWWVSRYPKSDLIAAPNMIQRRWVPTDQLKSQAVPVDDSVPAEEQHGQILMRGTYFTPHDNHPFGPLLWSEMSWDAQWLLSDSNYYGWNETAEALDRAMRRAPDDPLLRADWLATVWARKPTEYKERLIELREAAAESTRGADGNRTNSPTGQLWRLLVEASWTWAEGVEDSQGPLGGPGVFWTHMNNAPGVFFWPARRIGLPEGANRQRYLEVAEELSRLKPDQSLESPFEDRVRRAWRQVGLRDAVAVFASKEDMGVANEVILWHCQTNMEVLSNLAVESLQDGALEEAADRVESAERIATLLMESVRSPWVHNYVRHTREGLTGIAGGVLSRPDCPAEVSRRMYAIIGKINAAGPAKPAGTVSPYVAPAIHLDNLARGSLSIGVVCWLTAAIGALVFWFNARSRRLDQTFPDQPRGTISKAIATIVLAVVALVAVECTNLLGQRMASMTYAILAIVLFLVGAAWAVWLLITELSHRQKRWRWLPKGRLGWLVCFMVLLAILRFLQEWTQGRLGTANVLEQFANWAADPLHVRMAPVIAYVTGGLVVGCLFSYAILRWRRQRRENGEPPLVPPWLTTVVSALVAIRLVTGPPGELLSSRLPPAPPLDPEWSTSVATASSVAAMFDAYDAQLSGKPIVFTYRPGFNLMTVTTVLRVTSLGWWLVVACILLGTISVYRRRPSKRNQTDAAESGADPRNLAPAFVGGLTWSCIWLGFIALTVHAWSTLALSYCVYQVLARG